MAGNRNSGGNKNEKPFREMLWLAIQGAEGDKAELRHIAQRLVDLAKKGDLQAIREVADRIDGKPVQQNNHDVAGQLLIGRIERHIVDNAENSDG